MKLRRHFCIAIERTNDRGELVGGWKLEDWHLYRVVWRHSVRNASNRWWNWERII